MNQISRILNHADLLELTRQFIALNPLGGTQKRFGIYHIKSDNPFCVLAKHVEAVVFWDAFKNDESTLDKEYGAYEKYCNYILAVDHVECRPVGAFRLMMNSSLGLKTINAITEPPWSCKLDDIIRLNDITTSFERMCDVSTLAILPEYRSSSGYYLGLALYLSLAGYAILYRISQYTAILDHGPFNLLNKIGFPVYSIEGTSAMPYLGSESSLPVFIDYERFLSQLDENTLSIKRIKLLAMLASPHVAYSHDIDPHFHRWLNGYERYSYPLVRYLPNKMLKMFLKKG